MSVSIFNDVIGPVMRGPSSSHCAGALRIGRLLRDLMEEDIEHVHIRYDLDGSLAATHQSQGTDMGLCGGILGWDADDKRLPQYIKYINEANISIKIEYGRFAAQHPNTFILNLRNSKKSHDVTALSIGGGMIEIISVDDTPLSIKGDFYELLIPIKFESELRSWIEEFDFEDLAYCYGNRANFYQIKSSYPFDDAFTKDLSSTGFQIITLYPVLPVLSRKDLQLPFTNCNEMLVFNKSREKSLGGLALAYESARSSKSEYRVRLKMKKLVAIMKECMLNGLSGTEYEDRILPAQSQGFSASLLKGNLIDGGIFNIVNLYVSAVMESKSAMEVIVAAPTAGSCGVVPGVCLALADFYEIDEDLLAEAFLAGGLIGAFIAENATFAAEDAGCMAECGSAAGIAAASAAFLLEGTVEQCITAASMALQNSFGMICDPIANRVEAPCLGKNVMSAMNALSCANMALSGYDSLIPLDEVIQAMDQVGKLMPSEHCCTGQGGIAVTPTAKEISNGLKFSKSC